MLINKKAVKLYLQEKGKDTAEGVYQALDKKVAEILDRAAKASNKFKRIEDRDILIIDHF